jgi:hypothetical protein
MLKESLQTFVSLGPLVNRALALKASSIAAFSATLHVKQTFKPAMNIGPCMHKPLLFFSWADMFISLNQYHVLLKIFISSKYSWDCKHTDKSCTDPEEAIS